MQTKALELASIISEPQMSLSSHRKAGKQSTSKHDFVDRYRYSHQSNSQSYANHDAPSNKRDDQEEHSLINMTASRLTRSFTSKANQIWLWIKSQAIKIKLFVPEDCYPMVWVGKVTRMVYDKGHELWLWLSSNAAKLKLNLANKSFKTYKGSKITNSIADKGQKICLWCHSQAAKISRLILGLSPRVHIYLKLFSSYMMSFLQPVFKRLNCLKNSHNRLSRSKKYLEPSVFESQFVFPPTPSEISKVACPPDPCPGIISDVEMHANFQAKKQNQEQNITAKKHNSKNKVDGRP